MFTGIIETLGKVIDVRKSDTNLELTVESNISGELKIDQSVSHNGVCLTVVEQKNNSHRVTIISESLAKSNLADLAVGDEVNLERAMQLGARIDGHLVQGHVDQTGVVKSIDASVGNITVEKGSICINGVSLTVVNSLDGEFSVAIIPYTFEHTTFHALKPGHRVNLEFDVLGKYVARYMEAFKK
jgi:riboflavin synthase